MEGCAPHTVSFETTSGSELSRSATDNEATMMSLASLVISSDTGSLSGGRRTGHLTGSLTFLFTACTFDVDSHSSHFLALTGMQVTCNSSTSKLPLSASPHIQNPVVAQRSEIQAQAVLVPLHHQEIATGNKEGEASSLTGQRCKWYYFLSPLRPTELALSGPAIARAVQELGLQAPKRVAGDPV